MKKKIVSVVLTGAMLLSGSAFAYPDIKNHWAEYDISLFTESNIVKGYEDGLFRPNNYITREEAFQVMSNYIGLSTTEAEVPEDAVGRWSTKATKNLISRKIIVGYEDGTIKPQKEITRAEFAAMVFNYLINEQKLNDSFYSFHDLGDGWYAVLIETLAGNNVISGYEDGNFRPNHNITRAEVIRIMSSLNNIKSVGVTMSQLGTIASTKHYILYEQDHLAWAFSMNWDPEFLNSLTKRDLIDVYINYLNSGGNPNDRIEYGWYLTRYAPVKPDWKVKFEKALYESYGKTVVEYKYNGNNHYFVVVDGLNPPHGYFVGVNSVTGAYHG